MPPRFSKELREKMVFSESLPYQPRTSPCEAICPAGLPIQKMNTLIEEGLVDEALEYIRCRNPIPGVTGRICPNPCQSGCNRGNFDSSVFIRAIERYAADHSNPAYKGLPVKRPHSGKKIAVIGSGPAGLTCSYFSALLGHEVTVFESGPAIGGIPRNAVPEFRLPKDIVDREVGLILNLGVCVRTNFRVGRDIGLDSILSGFDACLIAVGAWKERELEIPGAEFAFPAVSWLNSVNLGEEKSRPGKRVVILGGGGVAFDAAFTAVRTGAREVYVVCLESPGEMCAPLEEVYQAEAEGIRIHNGLLPETIFKKDKGLEVQFSSVSSFCFDEAGCLVVTKKGKGGITIHADTVICAIGLEPDLGLLAKDDFFELTPRGTLKVNPATMETSLPGVFAAGDVVSGPATVAEAVGSGRKAAIGLDNRLSDQGNPLNLQIYFNENRMLESTNAEVAQAPHTVALEEFMNLDYFEKTPRRETECQPLDDSLHSLSEIDSGFTPEDAAGEAGRCFHCGHCISCGFCVEDCPGHILSMTPNGPSVDYPDECWHCGCCRISCPRGAVLYEFPLNMML